MKLTRINICLMIAMILVLLITCNSFIALAESNTYIFPITTEFNQTLCENISGNISDEALDVLSIYAVYTHCIYQEALNGPGAEGMLANDYDVTYTFINGESSELGDNIMYLPKQLDLMGVEYEYYEMIPGNSSTINYIMMLLFKIQLTSNDNAYLKVYMNPSNVYAIELIVYDDIEVIEYLYYNYNRLEHTYYNDSKLFSYNSDDVYELNDSTCASLNSSINATLSSVSNKSATLRQELESEFGEKNNERADLVLQFDLDSWQDIPDSNIEVE